LQTKYHPKGEKFNAKVQHENKALDGNTYPGLKPYYFLIVLGDRQ